MKLPTGSTCSPVHFIKSRRAERSSKCLRITKTYIDRTSSWSIKPRKREARCLAPSMISFGWRRCYRASNKLFPLPRLKPAKSPRASEVKPPTPKRALVNLPHPLRTLQPWRAKRRLHRRLRPLVQASTRKGLSSRQASILGTSTNRRQMSIRRTTFFSRGCRNCARLKMMRAA